MVFRQDAPFVQGGPHVLHGLQEPPRDVALDVLNVLAVVQPVAGWDLWLDRQRHVLLPSLHHLPQFLLLEETIVLAADFLDRHGPLHL